MQFLFFHGRNAFRLYKGNLKGGWIMTKKLLIYGKDTWPYTNAAREAFAKEGREIEYHNVLDDAEQMEMMLKYSDGIRKVPVIVDSGDVTIGFKGGTWGV